MSKIRNHISEKNGKKIVLLHGMYLNSKFQGCGFSIKFLDSKFQGNGFSFEFLKYKRNLTNFYSDFEFCSGMLLPQK